MGTENCRFVTSLRSWELYRGAQRRYRKEVRRALIDSWRTSCTSVNELSRSARLHKALCVFLDVEGALNNTSYESMVLLFLNTGFITPLYGGLELPWRAAWLRRLSVGFPTRLQYLVLPSGRCDVVDPMTPCCWWFYSKTQLGWNITQGYEDVICLVVVGKFPNTVSGIMQ